MSLQTSTSNTGAHSSQDNPQNLLLSHRAELVGVLAQATANQFNNIMMAITGYAEVELKKANPREKRSLENVLSQATQAAGLVQKLLDFCRKPSATEETVLLKSVIEENRDLFHQVLDGRLALELDLDSSAGKTRVDRVGLEKTLLSLVFIAMNSAKGSGKMVISTKQRRLDQKFIGSQDAAKPGEYVVLSVCDRQDKQAKSTGGQLAGATDQRTNLAIAVVREIVRSTNGVVRFTSQPDIGNQVDLYFPVAMAENEIVESVLPRNFPTSRTILLVEDDDAVRVSAAEFLMMEGFKVLQARTGEEALHVVEQGRTRLDILITDVFMPKMTGPEVAAKLVEQHAELKVLYISGDLSGAAPRGALPIPENATLQKPFRLDKLRDRIHDLLGQ